MKTLMQITVLLALMALASLDASAQRARDVMFTHFTTNTQAVNPAYAGSRQALTITSLNRSQWTTLFEKPPAFQSLSINSPTADFPMGLGLTIQNEQVGPEKILNIEGDVAYTVKTSHRSTLSFGIKAGISNFSVPLTQLIIDDPSDPLFAADYQSHWLPNFGFGMYFLKEHFYAGISIPRMLQTNPFTNRLYAGAKPALTERNYYFITGAAIPLNIDVDIIPAALFRYKQNGGYDICLTTKVLFFDKFSAGLTYRYNDAVGIIAGLSVLNHGTISYSFDWGIKNQATHWNSGTHELVLRYDVFLMQKHREREKRPF